jgi:hypothetical protein
MLLALLARAGRYLVGIGVANESESLYQTLPSGLEVHSFLIAAFRFDRRHFGVHLRLRHRDPDS